MSLSSAYLETSRHNIFYFRIRVPAAIRSFFPSADIRRSLQTQCRREAVLPGVYYLELEITSSDRLSAPTTP